MSALALAVLALVPSAFAEEHFPLERGMRWSYCAYHVHPADPDQLQFDAKALSRTVVADRRRRRHRLAVVRESEREQKAAGQSCTHAGPGKPVAEHFYLVGPEAVAHWGVFKSTSPAELRRARAGRLRAFMKLPEADLDAGVQKRLLIPTPLEKGRRWNGAELAHEADRAERVGGSFGGPSRDSLRVKTERRGAWKGARWYSPGVGLVLSLEPEDDGGRLKVLELTDARPSN